MFILKYIYRLESNIHNLSFQCQDVSQDNFNIFMYCQYVRERKHFGDKQKCMQFFKKITSPKLNKIDSRTLVTRKTKLKFVDYIIIHKYNDFQELLGWRQITK